VKIGMARRAVAEERECNDLVAAPLRRKRHTHGVRQLRRDGARPRNLIDRASRRVARHLPALLHVASAAEGLSEVELERKAAHEHHGALAESREHPITRLDCERRGDGDRLLAESSAEKTDSPLAAQGEQAFVEAAGPNELAVHANS